MSRRVSRRTLLRGAVGAAVTLTACRSQAEPADTTVLPRTISVAVVGDSIAYGARVPLQAALAGKGFTRIEYDAMPGRRITDGERPGLAVLTDMLRAGLAPDLWVIELGTNDLGRFPDASEEVYGALVDQVLAQLDPATPLVWVDTYARMALADCQQFNAALRARVDGRGNGAVAGWYDRCVAAPELVPDGLHPAAPEGIEAFAQTTVEPIGVRT